MSGAPGNYSICDIFGIKNHSPSWRPFVQSIDILLENIAISGGSNCMVQNTIISIEANFRGYTIGNFIDIQQKWQGSQDCACLGIHHMWLSAKMTEHCSVWHVEDGLRGKISPNAKFRHICHKSEVLPERIHAEQNRTLIKNSSVSPDAGIQVFRPIVNC